MLPRILLIGDQGQVAWELKRCLSVLGELVVVGRTTTPRLDLTDFAAIGALVETLRPQWIVNAAAYTAVDRAEADEAAAFAVNAMAVGALAESARRVGALLVHYSTDYVFDGQSAVPYRETAPTHPQSAYGRSKRAGEQAIAAAGGARLILRTSWVYGTRGQNFLRTIRRLAREREELRIVADQIGAPTWSRHIAEATAQMLCRLGSVPDGWPEQSGIYHLTSGGQASWFDFAEAIVAHLATREAIACQRVVPIATEDYPLPAPRPKFSVLCTDKLRDTFGLALPDWRVALSQVQDELDQDRI